MNQAALFAPEDDPNESLIRAGNVVIPTVIDDALKAGAMLISSASAGKDSQAMAIALSRLRRERGWTGRFVLLHADVGRMEWKFSLEHCRLIAEEVGAEFYVVKNAKRDLLQGIHERMAKRPDAPPFPSSAARWCTSDFKRGPLSKWMRNNVGRGEVAVSACGFRREESAARRKQPFMERRKDCCSPQKNRTVYNWNPILEYSLADVWSEIGHSLEELTSVQTQIAEFVADEAPRLDAIRARAIELGFRGHVSYALTNERCSCCFCVLGSESDARNAAPYHREVLAELIGIEQASGFTFQQKKPIQRLDEFLAEQQRLAA